MTLGELRAHVARLDARGHVGTMYHEELARLEKPAAPISQESEDVSDGTS